MQVNLPNVNEWIEKFSTFLPKNFILTHSIEMRYSLINASHYNIE